jgi:tripartite-type tricarboxylate transporter receptor subunit TctC
MKISDSRELRSVRGTPMLGFAWLLGLAAAMSTAAQEYPTKPVKLVVPFSAGSVQDLRGRHISGLLASRIGQPIVVDNRPGANGALGAALVAKARPDGYTLLLCTGATLAGNTALMPNLPYDSLKDFVPVVRLVTTSGIIAVSPGTPAKTLQQLLALAKAKPGSLRYGSGSSYSHILGELLARRAGVQYIHVPYKGDGQTLTDLMGGHIDLMFSTPILLVPHIKAGHVRALAIAGPRRLPALPDVPTTSEEGVPDTELLAWAGICAPARTPLTIVAKLNREALAAMTSRQVRAEVEEQGYEVSANTPEQFFDFISTDIRVHAALVKELAIPLER